MGFAPADFADLAKSKRVVFGGQRKVRKMDFGLERAVKNMTLSSVIQMIRRRRKVILYGILLVILVSYWFSLPEKLFTRPYSTVVQASSGELLNAAIADARSELRTLSASTGTTWLSHRNRVENTLSHIDRTYSQRAAE